MAPFINSEDPAATHHPGPAHRSPWLGMVAARDGRKCRGCGKKQERTRTLVLTELADDSAERTVAALALMCAECRDSCSVRSRVRWENRAFNDLVLQVLREERGWTFDVDKQGHLSFSRDQVVVEDGPVVGSLDAMRLSASAVASPKPAPEGDGRLPVPSAPRVTARLGGVDVRWNGLDCEGDVASPVVEVGRVGGDPDEVTVIGRLSPFAVLSLRVHAETVTLRLRSMRDDERSPWSEAVTCTTPLLRDADLLGSGVAAPDKKLEAYLRAAYNLPGSPSAGLSFSEGGDVGLEGSEDAQDTADGGAVGEGVSGDGVGHGPSSAEHVLTAVGKLLQVLGEHLVGERAGGVDCHGSSSLGDGGAGTSPGSATVEQGQDAEGGSR